MPSYRTYETEDLDAYIGYHAAATEGMLDVVEIGGPDVFERVLLKAPGYRRTGHVLALEGTDIVADAVALVRTIGRRPAGFVAWNALPEHRDAAILDGLLDRALAYLSPTTTDVRVLLRREHSAARKPLVDRGFSLAGVVSRVSGPTSRSRSGRAVRTLRPEDVEGVAHLLTGALRENPTLAALAVDGPFGTSVFRDPASGTYFAAERDDRAVGFIGVGARETVGLVDFIVVDPDYRRSGVGSSLLSTALFWLAQRGCVRAVTLVDSADAAAGEFFGRFSFELADRDYRTLFRTAVAEGASGG